MSEILAIALMVFALLYSSIQLFKGFSGSDGLFGKFLRSAFFFISMLSTLLCVIFGVVVAEQTYGLGSPYIKILTPFITIVFWTMFGAMIVSAIQLVYDVFILLTAGAQPITRG